MKTVIIACKTIEDELTDAMERTGIHYPVKWLESGLHNVPKKLNSILQETLDEIDDDKVLMALGACGNSILGLEIRNYTLIFPRVDDCISLLLGSIKKRQDISEQLNAYFLTSGWLRGERNIWVEHNYMLEKYGPTITALLEKSMYGHYRTLGLLDCGIHPIDDLLRDTKMIADGLNLEQVTIDASTDYIAELLTGPWFPNRFVIKPPHSCIKAEDLTLPK